MARKGGEYDYDSGKVRSGKMPRGSVEDAMTIKDGLLRRMGSAAVDKALRKAGR